MSFWHIKFYGYFGSLPVKNLTPLFAPAILIYGVYYDVFVLRTSRGIVTSTYDLLTSTLFNILYLTWPTHKPIFI